MSRNQEKNSLEGSFKRCRCVTFECNCKHAAKDKAEGQQRDSSAKPVLQGCRCTTNCRSAPPPPPLSGHIIFAPTPPPPPPRTGT